MIVDDFTVTPDAAEAFARAHAEEPDRPDRTDWFRLDDPREQDQAAWALYQSMTDEQRDTWFPAWLRGAA